MARTGLVKTALAAAVPAILLVAGLAYAGGWRPLTDTRPAAHVQAEAQRYGRAPSWSLTDQAGRQVSSSDLRGRVRVVAFAFPYCTTDCPLVARDLAVLQHQLAREGLGKKVAIVMFNVDPAGAGPKALRQFVAQFRGDPNPRTAGVPWYYVTGSPTKTRQVVTGGWHVAYYKTHGPEKGVQNPNPLAEKADVDYDIKHTEVIYIVGPHGKILNAFDSMGTISTKRLAHAVHDVLGRLADRSASPSLRPGLLAPRGRRSRVRSLGEAP